MSALPVAQIDLYKAAQASRFSSRKKASSPDSAPATAEPKLDELFACGICQELLYEAVSATCGHTFCAACWFSPNDPSRLSPALTERLALGINSTCPMCRRDTGPLMCNRAIDSLITKIFPEQLGERAKQSVNDRLKRQLLPELKEQVRRELLEQIRSEEAARRPQQQQQGEGAHAIPVEHFGDAVGAQIGDPDDGAEMPGAWDPHARGPRIRARPEPLYNRLHRRGIIRGTLERLIYALDHERNFANSIDEGTTRRFEALLLCLIARLTPIFRIAAFGLLLLCVYGIIAVIGYLRVVAQDLRVIAQATSSAKDWGWGGR